MGLDFAENLIVYTEIKRLIGLPFRRFIVNPFSEQIDYKINIQDLPKYENGENVGIYDENLGDMIATMSKNRFFYFYLRDFFIEKSESKSTGKKRFKYLGLRALRYSDSDIIKNKMFDFIGEKTPKERYLREDFSEKLAIFLSKTFNIDEILQPKTIIDIFIENYKNYLIF